MQATSKQMQHGLLLQRKCTHYSSYVVLFWGNNKNCNNCNNVQ